MSDPLSVAGSVAGIVSIGITVTQSLYDYYSSFTGQHDDVGHTIQRLQQLLSTLETVRDFIQSRKYRDDEKSIVENAGSSVQNCEECIRELEEEANKFAKKPTDGIQSTIKATVRRVAYPFRESTLKKLQEDIDDVISNLSLALQSLQQRDISYVRDGTQDIKDLLDRLGSVQISSNIREWLDAPDVTSDFNETRAKKHTGTGDWFIQGQPFTTWLKKPNSFLWLNGFAGCGKSVLSSTVIEHAARRRDPNSRIAVAFFFFTFNDDRKQDASAMLRSLVSQLSTQLGNNHTQLSKLHERNRNARPPDEDFLSCLRELLEPFQDVFLIIDALDESPRVKRRGPVLKTLNRLRAWGKHKLHLLVTSRDEVDIRTELQVPPQEIISMRNEAIDHDIASFVSHRLRVDRQMDKWKKFHGLVESKLTEKAKGV